VSLSLIDVGRRATTSDAYFTRSDVVRAVTTGATQGATLDQIEAKVDEFLSSDQAVELIESRVWTTPEILEPERRTVAAAIAGRSGGVGVADAANIETAVSVRPSLSDEQAEMIRRLTLSGNGFDIVVGRPGSGKTFALDAVRSAYEASGYRVIGTALAARAAKELEAGSGIPSRTAASLRTAIDGGMLQLDPHTVLVVDESAMVGTRMLAALASEASAAGAKVIAVGDPKQLPEIQAGGLFRGLADRLGVHELTGNRRQADPADRSALVDLREGRVNEALGRLVNNGSVTVGDNADLLRQAMIADWLSAAGSGRDVVMLALRRDDVNDLNHRARHTLLQEGRLGPT
jgi:ATP-dependent exoDNAse (exonuclease V) alpha subunit